MPSLKIFKHSCYNLFTWLTRLLIKAAGMKFSDILQLHHSLTWVHLN